MKKSWLVILCMLFCLVMVTAAAESYGSGVVNGHDADRVHLRAGSGTDYDSLGLYFTGTPVTYLSDPNAAWVQVQIGAVTGYMKSEFLTTGAVAPQQPIAIVANIASNDEISIYKIPQARAELAGTSKYGQRLTVLGETQDGWYYVQYGDVRGYVSQGLMEIENRFGAAVINGKTSDRVHLRAGAGTDYASLGLYFTGTPVTYLSDPSGTWVQVQIGAVTGYMAAEYLTAGTVTPQQPTATVANIARDDEISVYKIPQARAELAGTAKYGQELTVLGETQDGWYYVQYGSVYGYVSTDLLQVAHNEFGRAFVNGKTADRVHLRAGAGTNYDSLGLFFTGTPVTYLSDPNAVWVQVQIGAATGYMMSEYLGTGAVTSRQPTAAVSNIASNDQISIYKIPQARTEVAGWAKYGDRLTILGETQDGWYYVQYGDVRGYVSTDFLRAEQLN